jgi:ketosteroid isomerase-like protein
MADERSPRELLALYQAAMLRFSADDLSDLYTEDAVHEYGFVTPGHEPSYTGRAQIRQAYARAWASPSVELDAIRDLAVHDTSDPAVIVDEWRATGRTRDGSPIELAGVLVLEARRGMLVRVRDYMDVFGLASQTGRLASPTA